ncbi:MAG TPA: hypothetical protein VD913_00440 [bacterium]|nr:hypothetical protein [bacterium]
MNALAPSQPSSGKSRVVQFLLEKLSGIPIFDRSGAGENLLKVGRWLLAVMLFACIFIPRVSLGGGIHSAYSIDLRMEDFILLGLVALVAMVTAQRQPGQNAWLGVPSVEKAFLGFLIVAELSIFYGIFSGTVDKPLLSLLYLVKWFEYFLVFAVTVRLAANPKASLFFLKTFFILGLAVAAYGYWEHFFPFSDRIFPPYYRLFERFPFHGDANHIGGFFVLWIGFFLGLFLVSRKRSEEAWFFVSLILVLPPLLWTYSVKSFLGLAGVFFAAIFFRTGGKKLLLLIALLGLSVFFLPSQLWERLANIREALQSTDPYHSSWASNLFMWKQAVWNFRDFFLLGSGLGSRHRFFYESQYVLVLAETGIIGMLAFLGIFLAAVRKITAAYPVLGGKDKGIALGWFIGCTGLAIHNITCVSWTVVKVAIPFWFLTALVLMRCKSNTLTYDDLAQNQT